MTCTVYISGYPEMEMRVCNKAFMHIYSHVPLWYNFVVDGGGQEKPKYASNHIALLPEAIKTPYRSAYLPPQSPMYISSQFWAICMYGERRGKTMKHISYDVAKWSINKMCINFISSWTQNFSSSTPSRGGEEGRRKRTAAAPPRQPLKHKKDFRHRPAVAVVRKRRREHGKETHSTGNERSRASRIIRNKERKTKTPLSPAGGRVLGVGIETV